MENRTFGSLVGAGAGSAGAVGTVMAVGGGTSAAAITTGLATVGGLVGGGMLLGVGVLGAGVYGVSKLCEEIGVGDCVSDCTEGVSNACGEFCKWVGSWFD